jgi:hypothetical protein
VDAELELISTHRPKKTYLRTRNDKPVVYQRFLVFSKDKRDEVILNQKDVMKSLREKDEEFNKNLIGKYIDKTSYINIDARYKPVYNYKLVDVLHKPKGTTIERSHQKTVANINTEIPLIITDKLYDYKDIALQFIFRKSYYITHYDGVTYKFLYDIAIWLDKVHKLVEVESFNPVTKKREPLVLVDGGRKFPRVFLEGTVKKNSYSLVLHLSDQELRIPETFNMEEEGEIQEA